MPRAKIDVVEDTMVPCPRCGGDGVIGQRAGTTVPCPACGGEGRLPERRIAQFQAREARRLDGYTSEVEFLAGGREATRVGLRNLSVDETSLREALAGNARRTGMDDSEVRPGHVVVRPVGNSSPPRYAVVGGFEALARYVQNGPEDGGVPVEVVTETTVGDEPNAVDWDTVQPGGQ